MRRRAPASSRRPAPARDCARVLNALPGKPRVLTSDAEFDSIDFILRVYRDKGRIELKVLPFDSFRFEPCDLVVLSTVAFRTGAVFPSLKELVAAAHAGGAMVLLDVYHHAGVLPLDLAALDADFAIGGSYKYLRGGPGACWLYVHPRHHGLRTLDTGWFAKKDVFAYERPDPPQFAPGGDAWLESTPPVLAPFQALAGLELTLELGVERIREYNLAQKATLKSLAAGGRPRRRLRDAASIPARRRSPPSWRKQDIKTDARGDYLRLCPDYLNSRAELERAAREISSITASGAKRL